MTNDLVVVDASIVVKAILPNPDKEKCQAILESLGNTQFAAPALWSYEVCSSFMKAVHFGHLTEDEGHDAIRLTHAFDVHLIPPDEAQSLEAMRWAQKMKRASVYDCFYLAIAESLDVDMWTADRKLLHALQNMDVSWLHGPD